MSFSFMDQVENIRKIAIIGASALLAIGVLCLVGYLTYTKSQLQEQHAEDMRTVEAYKSANQQWTDIAKTQSAKISAMQQEAEKRAKEAADALVAAQGLAKEYSDKAQALASLRPVGDDCAATRRLIDSYLWGRK